MIPAIQLHEPSRKLSLVLGLSQILLWGGSFFLMAIVGGPIIRDTGWSHEGVYGALSVALLVSGLLAPAIGRWIGKEKGERIMRYSGIVMASGLTIAALAPHIAVFFLGWVVIGTGMAMGLYDALFAAMGKRYGATAGKSFTYISLISGFCTTVIWPLLTLLLGQFGWRGTLLIYAAVLLIIILPVYTWAFSGHEPQKAPGDNKTMPQSSADQQGGSRMYFLVMINLTIGAVLLTGISVHLIDILLGNHISLPAAVALGALLGPSQVGVRFLDLVLPAKSPVTGIAISSVGVLAGVALLLGSPGLAGMGIILYGLGNGMRTILRGTLPLHLFGTAGYAGMMGRLARPQLFAQACTPFIGGFLIQWAGISAFLWVLTALAGVNLFVAFFIRKEAARNMTNWEEEQKAIAMKAVPVLAFRKPEKATAVCN